MPACVSLTHLTTGQGYSRHVQLHRSTTGTSIWGTSAPEPVPAAGATARAWCGSSRPLHGHFPPRDNMHQSLHALQCLHSCCMRLSCEPQAQQAPTALVSMEGAPASSPACWRSHPPT